VIETFQLITLAVCCDYVSNLIGRRTINIPKIILGVHGFMDFTVGCFEAFTLISEGFRFLHRNGRKFIRDHEALFTSLKLAKKGKQKAKATVIPSTSFIF